MKSLLLSICLYTCTLWAVPEYNTFAVYAGLTYNILVSFENTHPGCSSDAVLAYLRSKALVHVRADAQNMGYSWRRVLKATYHIAMSAEVESKAILEALNKEMRSQLMWKNAAYWSGLVCAYFSAVVSFLSLGGMAYYFRFDKRVVNHYRFQSLGGFFPATYSH